MFNRTFTVLMIAASLVAFGCGDDDTTTAGTGGTAGTTAGTGGTGGTAGMAGTGGTGGTAGMAGTGGTGGAAPMDIVETAIAAGTFTQLAAALTAADLVDDLQGPGPFTVFAPTDDAFDAFEAANPGVLAGLTPDQLIGILTYHVVSGEVMSTDLNDEGVATTLSGSPVIFDLTGGAKVNDANITTADIEAENGVIHVIDTIILPPADDIVATAIAAGSFTSLAGALTDAELVDDLQAAGPFTVFAPTDAAFAALSAVPSGQALIDVLLYHVVSGAVGSGDLTAGDVPTLLDGESLTVALESGVQINGANVTMANILTKNGVIHVVDAVLVP